jgi:hypothetical protein
MMQEMKKPKEFFITIQNKMHYAVHGNTAAEVIFNRIDSEKENIGLTNFKGSMPTKAETEFEKYRIIQDRIYISDFDQLILNANEIKKEK